MVKISAKEDNGGGGNSSVWKQSAGSFRKIDLSEIESEIGNCFPHRRARPLGIFRQIKGGDFSSRDSLRNQE